MSEAALLLQTGLPAQQDKATLSFILLPKNLDFIVFYLQMLSINAFLAQYCEALSRSEQISRGIRQRHN
jgi:hypothetical protein